MSELWLPGQGFVPPHIRQAIQAIQEYDPDLSLGRDERNGQWVVLLSVNGRPAHPVLGLDVELPAPEEIKRRLYMADTRKRGREIVADVERARAREQACMKAETHDAAGEVAEAMDSYFHIRKIHPVPRIFVPS